MPPTTILEDEDSLIIIPTKRQSESSCSTSGSSNSSSTTNHNGHYHFHHQPTQAHNMNQSIHTNGNENESSRFVTTPTQLHHHKYTTNDLCSPPVISTRNRSTSSSVALHSNTNNNNSSNQNVQNTTTSTGGNYFSHHHHHHHDRDIIHPPSLSSSSDSSCIENSNSHHHHLQDHTTCISDTCSSTLNSLVSSPTGTTCSTLSNSSTSSLTSLLEFQQQPPVISSSWPNMVLPTQSQGVASGNGGSTTTTTTTTTTGRSITTAASVQQNLTIHYPQYTIPSLKELFVTRHGEKTSQLIKYGTGLHGLASPTSPPSSASSAETPSTPIDVNGDYDADPPLTERGRLCAKLFGQNFYLKYLVKKVEQAQFTNSCDENVSKTLQIYTSPFHRCLQTTEQIVKSISEESERDGKKFNIEVYIDFGLMEFYGLKRKWTLDMMPPNIDQIRLEFPFLSKFMVDKFCNEELNLEGLYFSLNPQNYISYFTEKNTMELMYDLIRRVRGTFYNVENNVKKIRTENAEPTVLLVTHAATMIRIVEELIGIYHKTPLSERTNVKASICGLSHLKRECAPKETASNQPTNERIAVNTTTTTVTTTHSTTAMTSPNDPPLSPWSLITNNDISFMETFESKTSQRSLQYYQIDSSHYVNRK
ncbi:hypothetical protein FDP41_004655 [Naegleria fowleri]|uniref:Uncharacterized protein n=1 Tax=Naegleria fowleri TaxID=5763 RepID=A0A6A5BTV1_NAEFO|nr:uncharacterized protein FDP41_004655 [Naegleria fowleri]KAF0976349.1 hypothetical protein FDP41_004655 [Naegleria fowleri]